MTNTIFKEGKFYNVLWKKHFTIPVPAKCISYNNELYLYNLTAGRMEKVNDIDFTQVTVLNS
jgi:hypothetical protein